MEKNLFISPSEVVGIAYTKGRDNTCSIVATFSGEAVGNENGAGNWFHLPAIHTDLTRLSAEIGRSGRYLAGRPIVVEGVNYLFGIKQDVIISHQDLQNLTSAFVGSGQASASPIPEIAAVLKNASVQVTLLMTISYENAERRALAYRVKGQAPISFGQSVLLSEAGVTACCRAFGWRTDAPVHQGGDKYHLVMYPGEQVGATISAKTDRQIAAEKTQKFDSWMGKEIATNDATAGWDRYLVKR